MLAHPSIRNSAVTGVILATLSFVTPLPWWVWATWVVLTALGVAQAYRHSREDTDGRSA